MRISRRTRRVFFIVIVIIVAVYAIDRKLGFPFYFFLRYGPPIMQEREISSIKDAPEGEPTAILVHVTSHSMDGSSHCFDIYLFNRYQFYPKRLEIPRIPWDVQNEIIVDGSIVPILKWSKKGDVVAIHWQGALIGAYDLEQDKPLSIREKKYKPLEPGQRRLEPKNSVRIDSMYYIAPKNLKELLQFHELVTERLKR